MCLLVYPCYIYGYLKNTANGNILYHSFFYLSGSMYMPVSLLILSHVQTYKRKWQFSIIKWRS